MMHEECNQTEILQQGYWYVLVTITVTSRDETLIDSPRAETTRVHVRKLALLLGFLRLKTGDEVIEKH